MCSPRSMNKAAMNANAKSQLGQREGEGAGMASCKLLPGHYRAFHLLRSMDTSRRILQPLWSCVHPW